MKSTTCLLTLSLLAVAVPCGATPIVFTATLDGASEAPPNASPGTGLATVTIDDVAHMMRVQVTFSGLIGTTTASHIHVINGPGDANTADTVGPVATMTPTFSGFPLGVTSGAMDWTFDMTLTGSYNSAFITNSGGTTLLAEAELFAAISSGRAYLNIHTTFAPGGEIRGFLSPAAVAAVPEPSTLGLVALGGLVLVLRRRQLRA